MFLRKQMPTPRDSSRGWADLFNVQVLRLRGLSFARPNEYRRCTCDPGPQEVYQARATFGHLLTLLRPPVVAFLFRLNRKCRWSQTQKNYDREPPLTLYVLHKSTPSHL